jgi:hypothetical protein
VVVVKQTDEIGEAHRKTEGLPRLLQTSWRWSFLFLFLLSEHLIYGRKDTSRAPNQTASRDSSFAKTSDTVGTRPALVARFCRAGDSRCQERIKMELCASHGCRPLSLMG